VRSSVVMRDTSPKSSRGTRNGRSSAELASFALAVSIGCAGRAGDPLGAGGAAAGNANGNAAGNGAAEADPAMPALQMMNEGMVAQGSDLGERPATGGAGVTAPSELCQQSLGTSLAVAPTVLVLADRSGSMFEPLLPSGVSAPWYELRAAALAVVQALAADVRFGFAAFAGSFGTCPAIDSIAPGLNNYVAIQGMYGALELSLELRDSGTLGALRAAEPLLANAPGDKFIWLLTDGEADYCKDGNRLCPVDSVVGQLQALASATPPIRTLVSGVSSASTVALDPDALQAFADAGMGQPAERTVSIDAVYDQCAVDLDWAQHFATTGKPNERGQTIGDYGASSGGTTVYSPLEQDTTTLIEQIRSVVLGDRPCAFDLALDAVPPSALATLDENARLEVDGVVIPYNAENGWHAVGASSVAIEGEACVAVRAAAAAPSIQLFWSCNR
jgi:hypothetical protein